MMNRNPTAGTSKTDAGTEEKRLETVEQFSGVVRHKHICLWVTISLPIFNRGIEKC